MTDDKLTKTTKMPATGLRRGVGANILNYEQSIQSIDPRTVPNRLGLVIDDSGSMGSEGMDNAHKAIKNFTNSCNHRDTSIAIYPLNVGQKPLSCDYDLINMYVTSIQATGGTSLYTTLQSMIEKESITRGIVFSDGVPTDSQLTGSSNSDYDWGYKSPDLAKKVVILYKEKEIPIDTIFIGLKDTAGYKELQELAKQTNGVFVCFSDTQSLSSSLKYLSPGLRGLLVNPEVKARIERGEKI